MKSVRGPCRVRVLFRLPPSKYPSDHPYGMSLDNLLKRLFDALQETMFGEAPRGDGCVIELEARKVPVRSDTEAGAHIEIEPLALSQLAAIGYGQMKAALEPRNRQLVPEQRK